jgi:hypothetical protein
MQLLLTFNMLADKLRYIESATFLCFTVPIQPAWVTPCSISPELL